MISIVTGIFLTCLFLYSLYMVLSDVKENRTEDITNRNLYTVKYPIVLSLVGFFGTMISLLIYIVFMVAYIRGNDSVGEGEFIFCFVMGMIFGGYVLSSHSWKIIVRHRTMRLLKIFHRSTVIHLCDIDHVEINKNFKLILYQNEKRLIGINLLCDNYELLLTDLKKEGVPVTENTERR